MGIGLGVLHLAPDVFWSMTLPELNSALAGFTGAAWVDAPLSRDDFGALMLRFPDKTNQLET